VIDIDDLNARLVHLGYEAEAVDHPTRPPIVVKPLGRREPRFEFQTVADAAEAFDRLAVTSQRWSLDLEDGNVDVDRTTGVVTPRDGGQPFNLADLAITESTGASNDAPPGVPTRDVRRLTHIVVSSQQRPNYGGWWYLAPPR
jgi:hypothetical protein